MPPHRKPVGRASPLPSRAGPSSRRSQRRGDIRRIDVAEGLALQGFPADWPLQGTVHDRYLQVGNAVPPQLAEAVGRALLVAHRVLLGLRAQGLDIAAIAEAERRNAVAIPTTRAA